MRKTKEQLKTIESIIKRAYDRNNRKLREDLNRPYNPQEPLGYSWRFDDGDTIVYNIVAADLGPEFEYTSYRIKMHEYGHVYFGHFDGIYEELDQNIARVLKNYRGQIIQNINEQCKIDFGDKLVEKVLDDPGLNHSLHNIAMDMEVNSKILSNEDVAEMEADITKCMPKFEEEQLKALMEEESDESVKKEIKDQLDKLSKETKIKLVLPCRYHTSDDLPFPDGLSYPEYAILILRNLSQFVKFSISIAQGGNGDTSEITSDQVKEALSGGMTSLNDLMKSLGMSDEDDDETSDGNGEEAEGKEGKDGENEGNDSNNLNNHDTSNSGGFKKSNQKTDLKNKGIRKRDHFSPSRKKADISRELGEIKAGGGFGCGNGGSPDSIRTVSKADEVDCAIEEVIRNTKSRVIKRTIKRDIIRNYNLGKNRTVISPSIIVRNRINTKPKLVYILDISGSMDTVLVDRILNTIAKKMKSINRGLKYDILTWSHQFGEWIKDIEPGKPIPKIHTGGGTSMANAIKFFKDNYDTSATFILISDFEDYLEEWCKVLKDMSGYTGWGFNYGTINYKIKWPENFSVRNFNKSYTSNNW